MHSLIRGAARLAVPLLLLSFLSFTVDAAAPLERGTPNRIHRSSGSGTRVLGAFPDATPVFHNGADLVCSDCHVTHASRSHAVDPGSTRPLSGTVYTGGANPNLLIAPDPLDLCLTCHDGQTFAPDVVGSDAAGLTQRSAGFFADPEVENPRGHDLGRGLMPAGGWDFCMRCHFSSTLQLKVTCVDCHNPHGNGVARNLQWASDPSGTPELGLFTNPAVSGLSRYESANVSFGTLDAPALREPSNICIDCHHVFSGGNYVDPDGDGIHNRHPAYDSERASTNRLDQGEAKGSSAPAHWNAGTGSGFGAIPRVRPIVANATSYAAGREINAHQNGVFCLSCHRAHGSNEPFSLVWPAPTSTTDGPGCDQCHDVIGSNP